MAVMAVLGAVSAAVNTKFVAIPKEGWHEPGNVYIIVALPPANNKSLVLREVMAPIEAWESERHLAMRDEIRRAISSRKNEESTIAGLRAKAGRESSPEKRSVYFAEVTRLEATLTTVPVAPKVYLNDVTPESLVTALAEQDGRIAIVSDEGGITETIAGLYSGGHAMILTPSELELLTAKTQRAQKRYGSQAVVLDALNIPYTTRPDGTLILFRRHIENGQTKEEPVEAPTVCL